MTIATTETPGTTVVADEGRFAGELHELLAELSDGELVDALVAQRRTRLGDEWGVDDTVTRLTAVGDVLDELLDDGPVDAWRERAAADLDRLGISPIGLPRLVAVA